MVESRHITFHWQIWGGDSPKGAPRGAGGAVVFLPDCAHGKSSHFAAADVHQPLGVLLHQLLEPRPLRRSPHLIEVGSGRRRR